MTEKPSIVSRDAGLSERSAVSAEVLTSSAPLESHGLRRKSHDSGRTVSALSGPVPPFAEDGAVGGSETVPQSLEDLPVGRRCRKCGRVVFVEGGHCPKPCGGFLQENEDAVTHGKRSRIALRRDREAILEGWRARYAVNGRVPPVLDAHLKQIAKLEAISDRAIAWSEHTQEPVTSIKHASVLKTIGDCSDRIGRHLVALRDMLGSNVADAIPAFHMIHVDRLQGEITADGQRIEGGEVAVPGSVVPMVVDELTDEDIVTLREGRDPEESGPSRRPAVHPTRASAAVLPSSPEASPAVVEQPAEAPKPAPRLLWRMENL